MSRFQREISSFLFPPSIRDKLISAGYRYAEDIDKDVRAVELAKEINCTNQEALHIIRTIHPKESPQIRGKSALELLHKEAEIYPIITFNSEIDALLGGGVPRGKITEFCGVPGVGKTQLGMQLAVDVHIPSELSGADGHCIYIDTEGSFVAERVREMAEALVEHLEWVAQDEQKEIQLPTVESILQNIHYYRVHDYVEQIALLHLLPNILAELPKVRLIIIDSITFHFRHDFENMSLRTRLLNGMAQNLLQIADKNSLAVVLINQVTTKSNSDMSLSTLVPALGESWGHTVPTRVMLYWENNVRYARLYKSSSQQAGTVRYQITAAGIRDYEDETVNPDAVAPDEEQN